jgi:hypothetical protein
MDAQKKQVVLKLKESKNILVTVSNNPSIDQLAACVGLGLMLNKLGKHASAVFSGEIPSTLDFLKPEDTLETNTNSLRDFIIALDRNKADKLRYKVEDKVVRIFITPYKTSISQDDLNFSEGDFNVDAVIALGVKLQQDIDQAVTQHGNILHDATVITLTTGDEPELGSIHWRDPGASGVSELAASLADSFDKNVLDEQIATAFLTGIVARTNRFSNELTSSQTMKVSSQLMAAGANQQLVASELEKPVKPDQAEVSELPEPQVSEDTDQSGDDAPLDPGLLEIDHNKSDNVADQGDQPSLEGPNQSVDNTNSSGDSEAQKPLDRGKVLEGEGPNGNLLTANVQEEPLEGSTDPLSLPDQSQGLLSHGKAEGHKVEPINPAQQGSEHESEAKESEKNNKLGIKGVDEKPETLDEIEADVHSSHLNKTAEISNLPRVSIGEDGLLIHHTDEPPVDDKPDFKPAPGFGLPDRPLDMKPPTPNPKPDDNSATGPTLSPPPVPPPMV